MKFYMICIIVGVADVIKGYNNYKIVFAIIELENFILKSLFAGETKSVNYAISSNSLLVTEPQKLL